MRSTRLSEINIFRRQSLKATVTTTSKKYLRRLLVETLESRALMASDLTGQNSDSYATDDRPFDDVASETNWILSLDADSLSEIIEAAAPGVIGVFIPPTLSFTTLANGMPILNSLLGSPTSVFLDFDGDTTSNTLAYDVDGNSTTFNAAEQNTIAEAWRHIATYFAMFDTNVTTIEPPGATPKAWEAIGNNIVGGYSAVGVFPNDRARSFNQSSDARTRQSGIAHEVGHNFGLSHQSDFNLLGFETADYSRGYDELHVPIMGVDFAQRVRKWIIGHTANASGLQDDINVITTKIKAQQPTGGDGFRADDFGGTIATATALTLMNEVQYVSGIIERMNDVDAFSFTSNGLPTTIDATADAPSGLDIKLEIFDALGVLVAAKDSALNDQEIILTLPVGTYYALLSSHGNYGDLGTYNLRVTTLPTGWLSSDIGAVGRPGFSQYETATDTFTLAGSGADIAGTSDEMQFTMQTLTDDGSITVRVASMMDGNASAKAGIEIRESTAANAKHVAMTATISSGNKFIRRTSTGGSSTSTTSASAAFAPVWLRLIRTGNSFTAMTSSDGTTWTQLGTTQTVSMNATVQIGLVVTAQNDAVLNVSTFDNVVVTGNLGVNVPGPNSLPAPTGVTVTRSTGSNLMVAWDNQAGETGYRVERSEDGVAFTSAGTTAADVTTFDDLGLVGSMRYFYRVLALDASGASTPSAIVSQINRPSEVRNLELTSLDQNRIVLDWIDTSGETGYRIERSTDGVIYSPIATVGVNIPSYTNTGLASGTAFFYRVTPTSSLGDGVSVTGTGATRLQQVTGLAFDEVTSTQTRFHWADIPTETGYTIERSTNGTTFTQLATVPTNTVTYTDSTVQPATEYYYRVLGTANLSVSLFNLIFAATPSATPLPYPWTSQDIGTVTGSGMSQLTSGTFKIISSGSAIGGTADSFRFTSQILNGNGSITARVATLEDTNGSARLGVMIRETLNNNAKNVSLTLRPPTAVVAIQSRSAIGGNTAAINGSNTAAPYWVRLSRAGNVFSGETSSDGVAWTTVGQVTVSMTSTVYIGLAATASSTTLLNTATVNNVSLVGDIRSGLVADRRVYYNRSSSSAFGNGDGNPTAAIDSSKTALLPGQTTSVANYTSYIRGLNGLVVDIKDIVSVTAADFQFALWNGSSSGGFVNTAVVPTITIIPVGGLNSSNRVKLDFPDRAISNTWLRVTVLANANTRLLANDVFYFGNAVGDVGQGNDGLPTSVRVDDTDSFFVRQNLTSGTNSAPITNVYDINKDGQVNSLDMSIIRQNFASSVIRFFTAPVSLQLIAMTSSDSFNINSLSSTLGTGVSRETSSVVAALGRRNSISAASSRRGPEALISVGSKNNQLVASTKGDPSATIVCEVESMQSCVDEYFRRFA
ncbi:MAG: hypothetical protein SGI77_20670 [Pirellulaceae bacterium]|nr:hypothetical protein [Pirellulaceae bacterium]